jgi:catechol-2,3-dioxygenase
MEQAPVSLSHTGFHVFDMDKMVAFYQRIFGFHVSDKAPDGRITFMSADPRDHHQLIMFKGRTAKTADTHFAHVAFRVRDMDMLRAIGKKLATESEVSDVHEVTHGNAWSIYFKDPEGNTAEAFVDTPWHVAQPFRVEMDIMKQSDEDLYKATDKMLDAYPTKKSFADWRKDFAKRLGIG